MTSGGPTALDVRVAELLVTQRLLTADAVTQLRARAASRQPGPSGSALLDLVVEQSLVPRPVALQLLQLARAGGAPPRGDRTRWTSPGGEPPGDRTHATRADAGERTQWTQPGAGVASTARPSATSERTSAGSQRTRWGDDDAARTRASLAGARVPDDSTRWEGGGGSPGGAGDVTFVEGGAAAAAAAAAASAATSRAGVGTSRTVPEPPEARYDVQEELGPGRLRVLDLRLQRQVVMLHAAPAEERRLARHARILAQLDHPAIPRVHDVLRWQGRAAFTTDAIEGEPFGASGQQNQAALLRAFLEVAAAVAHAHERGLVHGAIGHSRVVVGTFGRAWLEGWDVARSLPHAPAAVTRAAGDLGAAPSPGDAPRAPEVLEGDAPGTGADVWGLGRLLERVVNRAGRDAPPELRAIARKACARRPADRYRAAADLAEDVRRFIDGKAVAAFRETPVAAVRRLAKRHPGAASVAGAALVIVLASGLVTLIVSRRAYGVSRERAELAREQNERAAELLVAARGARDAALARRNLADRRLLLERALLVPEARTDDPDAARAAQLERAATLLRQLEEGAGAAGGQAPDTTFTAARVHRAAAEHHLRGAAAPDAARALVELRALVRLLEARASSSDDEAGPFDEHALARAQLAQAQLDRFLAARRLPGPAARQEEQAALDAMAELDETRELARLERAVRHVEEQALRLAARRPPEAVEQDPALLAAVKAAAASRPDLAYAHELRGRLLVALSVPNVHRSVGAAAQRHEYSQAFGAFLRASYLDPTEPEPRVSYLEVWNAKFALHFPWRFIGGWALGNALRAAQVTPRPEPTLRVARLLSLLDRAAATAPLLARWGPDADLPADVRAAVELARARALLAGGARVSPELLARLEPPAELAADLRALRGWALLRAGDPAGFDELMSALRTPPGPTLGLKDIEDALCDPRIEPRLLLGALEQAVPPPGTGDDNPVVHALLLARALARARVGQPDVTGDLPRLEQVDQNVRGPTRAGARFALAAATSLARQQPQHPGAHINALMLWARINLDVGSTEPEVALARDLIVERLRALGAAGQAAQFEGFDPVDEVYVRRAWMPPEVAPWRATEVPR